MAELVYVHPDGKEEWLLDDGQILLGVHSTGTCHHPCALHAPTDHHMRGWTMRFQAGVVWRECRCGELHPDPDDWMLTVGHRCCALECCVDPKERVEAHTEALATLHNYSTQLNGVPTDDN